MVDPNLYSTKSSLCLSKFPYFIGDFHLVFTSLQGAVDDCLAGRFEFTVNLVCLSKLSYFKGDVILLPTGTHELYDVGDLKTCLHIIGVGDDGKIKLILDCGFEYELVAQGTATSFQFENLDISSKTKQHGILVRDQAKLSLKQCRMKNFAKSIEVRNSSSCEVKWSEISDCTIAVSLEEKASFRTIGGLFEDCVTGILAEGDSLNENTIIEDTDNYACNDIEFVKPKVTVKIDIQTD